MPEPNINLLTIEPAKFDELFLDVLVTFVDNNIDNCADFYNISENYIPYLDRPSDSLQYFTSATSIYEYFELYYQDFYNYEWIINIIKDYGNHPENYNFNHTYDQLTNSMAYIVDFSVSEFQKYIIKT